MPNVTDPPLQGHHDMTGEISRRHPLPSSRRLAKSAALAAMSAATILILLVLPAEYEIDPTGFGQMIGLVPTDEERARALIFDPPMIPDSPEAGRPAR